MKNDIIHSGEFFALTLVSLWIGYIARNWLPIADLGSMGTIRIFEIAIGFILLSAVIMWLATRRILS